MALGPQLWRRRQESDSAGTAPQVSTSMLAWLALLSIIQSPTPPPKPFDCSAPEHRQFDFWLGEWDVVPNPETRPANAPAPPPGRKPASNVIEKAHSGCVLVENWDDRQ